VIARHFAASFYPVTYRIGGFARPSRRRDRFAQLQGRSGWRVDLVDMVNLVNFCMKLRAQRFDRAPHQVAENRDALALVAIEDVCIAGRGLSQLILLCGLEAADATYQRQAVLADGSEHLVRRRRQAEVDQHIGVRDDRVERLASHPDTRNLYALRIVNHSLHGLPHATSAGDTYANVFDCVAPTG
jgi:hypothetical protein